MSNKFELLKNSTYSSSSSKFKQQHVSNSEQDDLVDEVLEDTHKKLALKSGPTLLRQLKAASLWEAWVGYRREVTNDAVYDNPYTYDIFTMRNLLYFTIDRSNTSVGRISDRIHIKTVLVEFSHLVSEARAQGLIDLPKNIIHQYYEHCMCFVSKGILSNISRPKTVVGNGQVEDANKVLMNKTSMLCYHAQIALLLAVILFGGFRLGSLMPPDDLFMNDWKSVV